MSKINVIIRKIISHWTLNDVMVEFESKSSPFKGIWHVMRSMNLRWNHSQYSKFKWIFFFVLFFSFSWPCLRLAWSQNYNYAAFKVFVLNIVFMLIKLYPICKTPTMLKISKHQMSIQLSFLKIQNTL